MIPNKAIEKAMEGGWQDTRPKIEPTDEHNAHFGGILTDICTNTLWWPRIALDPAFWQALGKALGWVTYNEHDHPLEENCHGFCKLDVKGTGWQSRAHRFYELILTGGDTGKYWNDLLA